MNQLMPKNENYNVVLRWLLVLVHFSLQVLETVVKK